MIIVIPEMKKIKMDDLLCVSADFFEGLVYSIFGFITGETNWIHFRDIRYIFLIPYREH